MIGHTVSQVILWGLHKGLHSMTHNTRAMPVVRQIIINLSSTTSRASAEETPNKKWKDNSQWANVRENNCYCI